MSKSGRHEFFNQEVLSMNAVGIDVSKGKSTVAIPVSYTHLTLPTMAVV